MLLIELNVMSAGKVSNKLVDICVNLTDDVFSGKEDNIINEAKKTMFQKWFWLEMISIQAKKL